VINRSLKGKSYTQPSFEIEKGKIREFARAIGDDNPLFSDVDAAKKEGFEGLALPPTFGTYFTVNGRLSEIVAELELNLAKVLHGSQEYEYFNAIKPGDVISGETRVADIFEKTSKGGKMDFIVLESAYKNQNGDKVLIDRMTLVVRE